MKKSRILYVLKFLYENSDEENPVTSKQLIDYLSEQGFDIHRTTINSDIEQLIGFGTDIFVMHTSPKKYFICNRNFETVELKMLIDAVSSSKFITEKKSKSLIQKIIKLTSNNLANSLTSDIDISNVVKPINEGIYYILDKIVKAKEQKKCLNFLYFVYTPNKERIHKHHNFIYEICPYATFWRNDHYYVVGYCKKHEKITTFRIDRMDMPAISDNQWIETPDSFDPSVYSKEIFQMFDGNPVEVKLKCKNYLMDVIVDKFGEDAETKILDENHFEVSVQIRVSQKFYGWLFSFGGNISILEPTDVKNEFISMAKAFVQ